ncbi:MAG: type II secretion system F family protein [Candidatus Omnitrophica bacterium]|nr:type II secretion system F family protein [Candidatus Omnitrophota bacterium]
MGTFKYSGFDARGKNISGTIESAGLQAAIADLKERGLTLSDISEMSARKQAPASVKAASDGVAAKKVKKGGISLSFSFGGAVIKGKSLSIITRQLATLLSSGLALLRALRTIRDQQKGGAATVVENLATEVEQGALLSQAMAKHPKSFPRVYIAMVRAGESSGSMDSVLNRLAEFAEKDARLRGKIKAAMAYPTVIVIVATGIVAFIMLKIVPVFVTIFKDFEAGSLPPPTRFLIFLSGFLTTRLWLFILIVVVTVIVYRILLRIPTTKYMIDAVKLKIPLAGPVIYKTIIARFSRTLATLITSGVPILTAFEIVQETVGNQVVSKAIGKVHDEVKEGAGVSNPMARTAVFPPMLINMVAVGEETGTLDAMLDKVADAYEDEVDRAVEALSSMIEPILIVFMGGVVGFIVIALFMPLIKLAMSMSGG